MYYSLLLGFLACIANGEQQVVVDKFAKHVREGGHYGSCEAPTLTSCLASTCYGSNCGTFQLGVDANGYITSLFGK